MGLSDRKSGRWIGIVLVPLLLFGLVVVLYLVNNHYGDEQARWEERLAGLAEHQQNVVENWCERALEDSQMVANWPSCRTLLGAASSHQHHPGDGHLEQILSTLLTIRRVDGVVLVDQQGHPVASEGKLFLEPEELHRTLADVDHVHLSLRPAGAVISCAAPVEHQGHTLGHAVLIYDARTDLYPELITEPVPTRTGESLLVRPKGQSLGFLSPTRGRAKPALTRAEIAKLLTTLTPSGQAASLSTLSFDGHSVLVAARPIARTHWWLLVKIDSDEALQNARWVSGVLAATFLCWLAAVGGLGFGLWREQWTQARLAQTRLGSLLDRAPDAILWLSESGRVLEASRGATKVYGYPEEKFSELGLTELLAEPVQAREVLESLRQQDAESLFFGQHRRANGESFTVECRGSYLDDGFLLVLRDISDRLEQEKQLRQLWQAIEQSPAAAVITDLEGVIEYVSPAFTRITGYLAEEALGRNVAMLASGLTPPEDHQEMWATIRAGRVWHGEFCNRRKSGEIYWEFDTIAPSLDSDGQPINYIAIKEDITAARAAREQLEQARHELEQAQKLEAVGRLAAGVAHDYNNLLTILLGDLHLLDQTDEPDEVAQIKAEMRATCDQAQGLTRQLLAFSRRQELAPTVLEMNEALERCSVLLRRLVGEQIELTVTKSDEAVYCLLDPIRLEQLLLNLVVNARDAVGESGHIRIRLGRRILNESRAWVGGSLGPGDFVVLEVEDDGHGMDAETVGRIFEPFFTTKPAGRGTGLGLSTVFGIVRQSGGGLWVESEPGRFTRFELLFRTCQPPVEQAEPVPPPVPRLPQARILVVEDDRTIRRVLARILTRLGQQVVVVEDGTSALETARSESFDLMISDVVLPGIGGLELAGRVAEFHPGIKVLFMSGYHDVEDQLTASDHYFLPKPFTAAELEAKLGVVFAQ
ncbi:MAG: PAS domain S-box protein [Vulcanimicrobiota bacterium]